jgi:hypothetical protein
LDTREEKGNKMNAQDNKEVHAKGLSWTQERKNKSEEKGNKMNAQYNKEA